MNKVAISYNIAKYCIRVLYKREEYGIQWGISKCTWCNDTNKKLSTVPPRNIYKENELAM